MRPLVTALLAFAVVAIAQAGCLAALKWDGVVPSLPAILAIHLALHSPRREAALLAAIAGFGADLLSVGPIGLNTAVFALGGLWIESMRSEVVRDHPLTIGLFCGMLAFVSQALAVVHLKLLGGAVALPWTAALWPTLFSALLTALLGPLVGRGLYRWRIGMRVD